MSFHPDYPVHPVRFPSHADALKRLHAETPVNENTGQAAAELNALLPAVLDRAFRGELA